MTHRGRRTSLVLTLLSFCLAGAAPSASPTTGPTTAPSKERHNVSPAEQAQFQQQHAAAQMQELEGRMFRLAETIRNTEPSDSARLLLGVRKAREELILEQMKEVMDLIGQKDLNRATDEQKRLIAKLEELKKLLLAGDDDLILQLERLKKMEADIAKLD